MWLVSSFGKQDADSGVQFGHKQCKLNRIKREGGRIIVDTQASLAHNITVTTDGHVMETTVGLNESEP